MSKGSRQRAAAIPADAVADNWARTFGAKPTVAEIPWNIRYLKVPAVFYGMAIGPGLVDVLAWPVLAVDTRPAEPSDFAPRKKV